MWVPATTIDQLVYDEKIDSPQLIKIDIEGAELLALQGAPRVLEEHSTALIIQVRRDETSDAVRDLLEPLGYRGVELKSTGGIADDSVVGVCPSTFGDPVS